MRTHRERRSGGDTSFSDSRLLNKSGHATRARARSALSSAQDISQRPQRFLTETQVAVRRSLSTHFETQDAHGQSQSAEIRSRLAQDRSRFADSVSGFADCRSGDAVDRSGSADFPSHGTKVPSRCARGRSGSALDRSQDTHGRPLGAKGRSQSACDRSRSTLGVSEDTQLQSRTARSNNQDARGRPRHPSFYFFTPTTSLLLPRERACHPERRQARGTCFWGARKRPRMSSRAQRGTCFWSNAIRRGSQPRHRASPPPLTPLAPSCRLRRLTTAAPGR